MSSPNEWIAVGKEDGLYVASYVIDGIQKVERWAHSADEAVAAIRVIPDVPAGAVVFDQETFFAWIDEERRVRQRNRHVYGIFRWRYRLDRVFAYILRLLGR